MEALRYDSLWLTPRLWTEDHVTHVGERFHLEDVTLRPRPEAFIAAGASKFVREP